MGLRVGIAPSLLGKCTLTSSILVTPAKEVMFSLCLFVCLFVSRLSQKLRNRFSQNSVERFAHRPRKKPVDFSGNPVLYPVWEF